MRMNNISQLGYYSINGTRQTLSRIGQNLAMRSRALSALSDPTSSQAFKPSSFQTPSRYPQRFPLQPPARGSGRR